MSQLIMINGILQRCGYMRLADDRIKSLWPVFPCRYDEFVHVANLSIPDLRICLRLMNV